ncbi:hypothetical protein C8Q79DRAFT_231262 [Trametes meyenii]|nr:hypothetical protein C8Q79DRAFT_231262 [Trametes meyenii]
MSCSPPRKRTKLDHIAASAVSRVSEHIDKQTRTRCTQILLGLPTEICLMIFEELLPEDLLHLTRTCKSFRTMLLSRSLEDMWKAAMERVPNMPSKPSFISIPAFVHVLYTANCHVCGSPNAGNFEWCMRPTCQDCLPTIMVPYERAAERVRLVNTKLSSKLFKRRLLVWYFEVMNHAPRSKDVKKNLIPQPAVERIIEQYKSLCGTTASDGALDLLVDKFTSERLECLTSSALIQDWHKERKQNLVQQRLASIVARLNEQGWKDIIEALDDKAQKAMTELSTVCRPAKMG